MRPLGRPLPTGHKGGRLRANKAIDFFLSFEPRTARTGIILGGKWVTFSFLTSNAWGGH